MATKTETELTGLTINYLSEKRIFIKNRNENKMYVDM